VSNEANAVGDVFNYTFTVRNLGAIDVVEDITAYNVALKDTFPVGIAPTSKYWIVGQFKQQIQPKTHGDGELCSSCNTCILHLQNHDQLPQASAEWPDMHIADNLFHQAHVHMSHVQYQQLLHCS
jgi:uncharacterized repeat protein (TIGR01451 family)